MSLSSVKLYINYSILLFLCWSKHNNYENNTKKNRHPLSFRRFKSWLSFVTPLAHISNPISESIHISPLITTIKKNKIVNFLFNIRLNIFTNSSSSIFTNSFSSIFTSTPLHLYYNIYSFKLINIKML